MQPDMLHRMAAKELLRDMFRSLNQFLRCTPIPPTEFRSRSDKELFRAEQLSAALDDSLAAHFFWLRRKERKQAQ